MRTLLIALPCILLVTLTHAADYPGDQLFQLAGSAGLPRYLKSDLQALADREGIRGGQVRTIATDFINHDFVFDVIVVFRDEEKSIAFVGIGENARDGGWIVNSVLSRVHGPGHGGYATLTLHRQFEEERLGSFKTAGPHLFRIEKTGAALTISVAANYSGGDVVPDFSKTIPDLKRTAPYLTRLNSSLFFAGDATFTAVRLSVDGQPVSPGAARNPRNEITGAEGLFQLSGARAIPEFLDVPAGPTIDRQGLRLTGKSVRSKESDLINRDFTFDVVFRFAPDEKQALIVGVGEDGHDYDWVLNSVFARVQSPRGGAGVRIGLHRTNSEEPQLGNYGKDRPGAHLLRLSKYADALTFGLVVNFTGKYDPDFEKTIPNVRQLAPYLTPKNSAVFVHGGGTLEQIRLLVGN